jgi:hypothetical protein
MNLGSIPKELLDQPNWVRWWYTPDGKKMFVGKSNDRSTWHTIDDLATSEAVAFVIPEAGQYVGVDLDDVIGLDGVMSDEASEILNRFIGVAYAELSPSGSGLKLITRGRKPDWAKCELSTWLECYDHARFWCMTGRPVDPSEADWMEIGDGQEAIDWLCDKYLRPSQPVKRPKQIQVVTAEPVSGSLIERAEAYVAAYPPSLEGGRNNAAFKLAGHLFAIDHYGERLTMDQCFHLVWQWNCGLPNPLDEVEIRSAVESSSRNGTPMETKPATSRAVTVARVLSSDDEIQPSLNDLIEGVKDAHTAGWPARLMRPPGFMGEVVDFIQQQNPRPSSILALPAAIALQATLLGNKWRDKSGNRANLYLIAVAPPGAGKAAPIRVVQDVLTAAGAEELWGGKPSSDSAMASDMKVKSTKLYVWDEFGKFLQKTKMTSGGSATLNTIQDAMLELWGINGGTWKQKSYSDSKLNKQVDDPCMLLHGSTTPGTLWAGFDESNLLDGFCARLLIFQEHQYGPLQETEQQAPPESIIQQARYWVHCKHHDGNLPELNAGCRVIPETGNARHYFREMSQMMEDNLHDEAAAAQWARSSEKARRLAICYACSRDYQSPLIDDEAAQWACDVVRIATQQFLKAARSEITGSDWQTARWKKVLSYIKSETKRRQPVSRSSIMRKFRMTATDTEKILSALSEAREIEAVAVADPRPGRPGTYYRAMG